MAALDNNNKFGLAQQPDPAVLLSVALGQDMTEFKDLAERLTLMKEYCDSVRADLDKLTKMVEEYQKTTGG